MKHVELIKARAMKLKEDPTAWEEEHWMADSVIRLAEALAFYSDNENWQQTKWNNREGRDEHLEISLKDICKTQPDERAYGGKRAKEALADCAKDLK